MKSYSVKTVTILIVLGMITGCSNERTDRQNEQQPVSVQIALPQVNITQTITASGQVVASETAMLSTRVMGFIQAFHVKPGDAVTKGQLLISISNTDILAKKAQAKAMVSEAEAALTDAQKDLDRYKALYKQQSASEKELENMTLHVQSLTAKTESARQLQRETESMLSYTQLAAPFSGVVTQKLADEGSMANPGMPLLVLEKNGNYEVTTSVTETDIAKLRTGMEVMILLKSMSKKITGTISEISPSSSNSGGHYAVIISLSTGKGVLYPGMSATVFFSVPGSSAASVLVPASAIIYKDQLAGLYTISESKTAMIRWIRLGRTFNNQVEVLSGLNPTEPFIVSADSKLYNGIPVQVKSN